jgi:hypothetical protein
VLASREGLSSMVLVGVLGTRSELHGVSRLLGTRSEPHGVSRSVGYKV